MVCVAAFIILAVCVLSIPVLRIFNRPLADKIWSMFKSAWYCVGRRVTFRKCDSNFKDQVKNSLLKKVVLKHPGWVKPISVLVEILSVLIIAITIWSLLVAGKAATTLIVYGTCDVQTPEACAVGDAEACYAGSARETTNPIEWTANWFVEWGEAFMAIPLLFTNWDATQFIPDDAKFFNEFDESKPTALIVVDPGCQWCRESYYSKKTSGFFDQYNTAVMPYALQDNGQDRFSNSSLVVRYVEAVRLVPLDDAQPPAEWQIIDRLFTWDSPRRIVYQEDFKNEYSDSQAGEVLNGWLSDFGYNDADVQKIIELVDSDEVAGRVEGNRRIVEDEIQLVKIPTAIFDGRRHDGIQ